MNRGPSKTPQKSSRPGDNRILSSPRSPKNQTEAAATPQTKGGGYQVAGGELIGFGSSPSVKPVPDLQRALPAACLFVASLSTNVPDNILHGDLEKQFSPFGLLTEVKVVRDHFKRPYAFVQFENVESAENALENSKGLMMHDRDIRIERAKVNRSLIISSFPANYSKEDLLSVAERYGPVENVEFPSKGVALVKWSHREDCQSACLGLRLEHKWIVDWPLDKKPTAVSPAPALNQEPKGIFIGKLNPELVNLNNLRAAFEGFGEIEWMTLKNKNTLTMTTNSPITPAPVRLKPAYAFITFKLRPSASKAIEAMNGSIFLERVISVSFCDKRSNQGRSPSGQQQQQSFLISFESPLHGDGLYTSKRMSIDSSSSSLSTPHRPVTFPALQETPSIHLNPACMPFVPVTSTPPATSPWPHSSVVGNSNIPPFFYYSPVQNELGEMGYMIYRTEIPLFPCVAPPPLLQHLPVRVEGKASAEGEQQHHHQQQEKYPRQLEE